MEKLKIVSFLFFVIFVETTARTTIDLNFFQSRNRPQVNSSVTVTTAVALPSIPQRIHSSLNNVLRIPLPIWGTSNSGSGLLTPATIAQTAAIGVQPGPVPGQYGLSQPAPSSFLPLPDGIQSIHSTISQLSTLTHWPFGYVTTTARTTSLSTGNPSMIHIGITTTPATITVPAASTAFPTTTTTANTPESLDTAQTVTPLSPLPTFLPPASPIFPQLISQLPARPSPSLPNRIHNRLQSTLGSYIRLPNLSQVGQPPTRPMLTEPPWVTELLGPTLEPPTTRAPTLGERVHNTINNVLLFVPATLLNFWYQNWGTQHVDRIIQRLQVSTPRPGSTDPVFATISHNNAFVNFTSSEAGTLPAIAAFINANGTLMPTIVHPVVNITKNTIEYQLRSENNETTVLWVGSLSNDIFFGNRTAPEQESEDDEDEQIKNSALNVKLK